MEWHIPDDEDSIDEIFDRAEKEGPQRVLRGGARFLVIVEKAPGEENRFIRAFLDEPEFVDIGIDRIDAPIRDAEL